MKFLEAQRQAKAQKETGENKMLSGSPADRTENKARAARSTPRMAGDPRAKRQDQTGIQSDPPISTLRPDPTKPRATPGAQQLAESLNVDLSTVKGTGDDNKITTADVRRAHAESTERSSERESETDGNQSE